MALESDGEEWVKEEEEEEVESISRNEREDEAKKIERWKRKTGFPKDLSAGKSRNRSRKISDMILHVALNQPACEIPVY